MNYGLYISASGASSSMALMDARANNLANVNTAAFKPDVLMLRARDAVRVEDNLPFANSVKMLERLGAGVMPMPTAVDLSQGPIQHTDNPLDIALEGKGFMLVRDPRVAPGPTDDGTRLTRDGRLAIRSDGVLVTAAGRFPILGEGGTEITLSSTEPFQVFPDGRVIQGDFVAGRIALTGIQDPSALRKTGDGLYTLTAESGGLAAQATDPEARIVQGAYEGSAVDPVRSILAVTTASSAAQGNLRMISLFNDIMGQAVGTLGRIS